MEVINKINGEQCKEDMDGEMKNKLDVRFISMKEAKELSHAICEEFKLAFELLKDK